MAHITPPPAHPFTKPYHWAVNSRWSCLWDESSSCKHHTSYRNTVIITLFLLTVPLANYTVCLCQLLGLVIRDQEFSMYTAWSTELRIRENSEPLEKTTLTTFNSEKTACDLHQPSPCLNNTKLTFSLVEHMMYCTRIFVWVMWVCVMSLLLNSCSPTSILTLITEWMTRTDFEQYRRASIIYTRFRSHTLIIYQSSRIRFVTC